MSLTQEQRQALEELRDGAQLIDGGARGIRLNTSTTVGRSLTREFFLELLNLDLLQETREKPFQTFYTLSDNALALLAEAGA